MNYLTRLCRLLQRLDYSDDQPRDENGRWGSGSGDTSHEHFKSAGVKVKDDLTHAKVQKSAQELFGRHIGPTDVSAMLQVEGLIPNTSVEYSIWSPSPGVLSYSAQIKGRDGQQIAEVTRQIERSREGGLNNELVVHQDLMKIDKDYQGNGLGSKLFGRQLEQYAAMGVRQITTDAAWVGQYQWAKMGYSLQSPSKMLDLKSEIKDFMVSRGVAKDKASEALTKVQNLQQLAAMRVKGSVFDDHADRVGKAFLIARGKDESKDLIAMKFDLKKGSENQRAYKKAAAK